MISREHYNGEFTRLLDFLEIRRRHHKKFFYINSLIAALLFYLAFFQPSVLNSSGFEPKFFIIVFCIALVMFPIFRYRGINGTAMLKPTLRNPFSLKDEAYSRLFKLFGPIEFAPHGGVSLLDIRKSTLFPDHRIYYPEDYAVGRLNNMLVKLCEANIVQVKDQKKYSVFHGLILVCDISEVNVKLRAGFNGRTAFVDKGQKSEGFTHLRYEDMKKLPVPGQFESALDCYSTDPEEARTVVTAEILAAIDNLAAFLRNVKRQEEHWDDKVAYSLSEYYDYCADKIAGAFKPAAVASNPDPEGFKGPAEEEFDKQNEPGLDLTKADPMSTDITALNRHFEIEFYEDKFIVTLPCPYDLFEPNSLFEPPLNDEDASLVYALMQCIDTITLHLAQVEP